MSATRISPAGTLASWASAPASFSRKDVAEALSIEPFGLAWAACARETAGESATTDAAGAASTAFTGSIRQRTTPLSDTRPQCTFRRSIAARTASSVTVAVAPGVKSTTVMSASASASGPSRSATWPSTTFGPAHFAAARRRTVSPNAPAASPSSSAPATSIVAGRAVRVVVVCVVRTVGSLACFTDIAVTDYRGAIPGASPGLRLA
ncbi:MAG: hypothetical protein NTW19_24050 [Planctomycetota bacterium]|nr:hypothetical protein [Planctomycetota bacterium]